MKFDERKHRWDNQNNGPIEVWRYIDRETREPVLRVGDLVVITNGPWWQKGSRRGSEKLKLGHTYTVQTVYSDWCVQVEGGGTGLNHEYLVNLACIEVVDPVSDEEVQAAIQSILGEPT